MMNLYSLETEVKYRKEQLNRSLPRVDTSEQSTFFFKLKEIYGRITSKKAKMEVQPGSECQCAC